MPNINRIQLPSGGIYEIEDSVAREAIAGGISFIVAWDGTSTPVVANIPAGVKVTYQETTYTGTLAVGNAQPGAFYLVKSSTQAGSTLDVYDEYVVVKPDLEQASTWYWEKIGDTQIDLSNVVTGVSIEKDNTSVVTGVSISVSGGTTDEVYGTGTTFALTNGAVTFGTPSKETFITSVSAETNKNLVTTSIVPTDGTESVSKVTKTASKLVTTSITPTDGTESVSKVTQTNSKLVTTSVPNVTSAGSADTWSFTMGTGDAAKTLIIGGGNGTAPTLGTAITVATGSVASGASGADVVTSVSIADKTVAKAAASAVTVATGSVASNASGTDIITGVTIVDHNVAKVGTAVTVATGATSTTGSGSAIVTGVTIGSSADAITALPTAAVGTGITVGTGDKVTVVKTIGTISANVNTSNVLGANTSLAVTKGGI